MKKFQIIIIIILLFNIFSNTIGLENNIDKLYTNSTIYVNQNNTIGPWFGTIEFPYYNINDGLNKSLNGDTIYVFNGIYNEQLKINKSISLIGENSYSTIINGSYKNNIIEINSNNFLLKKFTIKNSGGFKNNSAIYINSHNNTIINCQIYRSKNGIYTNNSDNNIIDNCSIHHNGEGIKLSNSKNNSIIGCFFSNNSIGINIYKSNKNNIYLSYMKNNGISNLIEKSNDIKINTCNISNNQVNLGGLFIKDSKNISINNSIIYHNGAGFHIYSSESIFITNCEISLNTHYGLIFRTPSKNITISKCNIKNNKRYAFYLEKNNIIQIKNSNIYENYLYGIYSRFSKIDAKNNYWGSTYGPSIHSFKKSDKINLLSNIVKTIPWKTEIITECGANWKNNKPYMEKEIKNFKNKISNPGLDSDNDNIPDYWEIKWGYDPYEWNNHEILDPDNDGLNNIEECYCDQFNSNPFIKDIFLEIDWMESNDQNFSNFPPENELEKIVKIFQNKNINLHIIYDEEIPYCNTYFSFSKLKDLYWNYFLDNNINNPKKGIFRYALICNYCPDLNFPFIGWYNLDSFAISAKWLQETLPHINKSKLITGAIVHHLGHLLNLDVNLYDGIDNFESSKILNLQWFKFKNYKSSMNYYWKYKIYSYSDGSHGYGDFNDWINLNFSFFKNSNFELKKI